MGLFDFLFGNKDKIKKLDTMNPQQQQIFNNLLSSLGPQGQLGQGQGQALGLLQQYLDPNSSIYKNFEQPYINQFENKTVPMLAERFAGLGGSGMSGALSSSGFGQSLSSAGSDLQTNLAAMKSGIQQQAINSLLGQYQQSLGQGLGAQPFSYLNQQGSSGFLAPFLGAAVGSLGGGGLGALGGLFQSLQGR